ncbi:hypothetical protein CC86DRAFT_365981 [Ophiobolus disseminans]|uniref:DUF3074 domain-containing protein n=1 Tax=Ophiobolus disseminans TaxID=1469910 RepID=A0A6A7AG29_9PLEO|nr:hypothetical protein CC86DRAFT_365981 [Ophiobolus disseminans]
MGSALSSGAGACKYCPKPATSTRRQLRQYSNIHPLCLHQLPPHIDLSQHQGSEHPTLTEYLIHVFTETYRTDFDDHTWSDQGRYPSSGGSVTVSMPPFGSILRLTGDRDVPVEVDKRVKGEGRFAFLARRSCHHIDDVEFSELDTTLAQDHCGKEALYDPSIFDGIELLKWDAKDLQRAVIELDPEWRVERVQMSMYEMFHELPKIGGKKLLQNRVFHVLCITAHSSAYHLPKASDIETMSHAQSHTMQLAINIHALQNVQSIVSRSRFQASSKTYSLKAQALVQATERQKKHNGNKVTEGKYCSLERLREACDRDPDTPENYHRWDMMTKSDAGGCTRLAPRSTKRKETLNAIAKDVEYVLQYIRQQRLAAISIGDLTF